MQIGDLVTLSSAGRGSQQNMEVKGCFGLLVAICPSQEYPYKVEWYGGDRAGHNREETKRYAIGGGSVLPMKRYELKMAKK